MQAIRIVHNMLMSYSESPGPCVLCLGWGVVSLRSTVSVNE